MRLQILKKFSIILFCFILTSCMVGPNFHSPTPPQTTSYTGYPNPKKTVSTPTAGDSGKSQYFYVEKNIPSEWWRLFRSRELNNLILEGIRNSPNLAAAEAALRQSQDLYYSQFAAALIPNVTGNFSGVRQKFADASIGFPGQNSLFNLFNASATVTYNLDIFGGARRNLESLCAQINYQRFQVEAAYLTLTANITTTAIAIAALKGQIAATNHLIQLQTQQLDLIQKQYNLGAVSQTNVLAQLAQLNQTKSTLPLLEKNLAINKHTLSLLIGSVPDEKQIPPFLLQNFHLPADLPITLPSQLVRQRPDIRASEALLHAASAKIGVATANLFPQINLTGNYGWESNLFPTLFTPSTNVWSYGASLTQVLFDGGALWFQRRAAIEAYNQASAQYCQVVLAAFKNVADVLRSLEQDAKQLQADKAFEISAAKSMKLFAEQYRLGGINYALLIDAQKQYQQAIINRIRAESLRFQDTVALFQALGGGWWNRPCECHDGCHDGCQHG